MNDLAFKSLTAKDVLKFVVGSIEECGDAMRIIDFYKPLCHIYFSPVFGKIEPKEIVKFLLDSGLDNKAKIQLQMHKFIWDPNMKGV